MYLLLIVVLVADNWFINIMNLYTGGFAVVNVIGRIGRFWSTVIVAVIGVSLSAFKGVYDNTPTFVNEIGFAFAPVGGILLAHYVLLSRGRIDLPAIYTPLRGAYRYLGGVNPIAIVVGVGGYLVARSEILSTSLIRPLAVVVITGAVYAVAMALAARIWPPARDAIDHENMQDSYDPVEIDRRLVAA
jgi:purine-cytosine permease-like protein